MQSSLKPKPADDPHDCVVIPSDAVRVAPSDEEISDLLRAAARQHSDGKSAKEAEQAGEAAPPVDATFRPTAVNDDFAPRRSRVMRAITTLLVAACVAAGAVAWQASGNAARKMIGKWLPQFALTGSLPLSKLGLNGTSGPSGGEPAAADVSPAAAAATEPVQAQVAAEQARPPQSAPETALSKSEPSDAPSLQSMARDLATVRGKVEGLKASIAELKASQQQMSRDLAKASEAKVSEAKAAEAKAAEQAAHAKMAPAPARAAVANARKPAPLYSPSPAAPAPANRPSYSTTQAAPSPLPPPLPPPAQPYAPRQVEPMAQSQGEVVPRPPMPVQ